MRYEDELHLLDRLSRGRKADSTQIVFGDKYRHHQKNSPPVKKVERKTTDMLRTAAGKKQAILKISSYSKGRKKVLEHLRYISRQASLELEDQDGKKIKEFQEHREYISYWEIDFSTNKRSRDTMNLILSTPPGTDRQKALDASRDFLATEFGQDGHEYLFVRHDDTEHPHIHAVIKMVSVYGKKLNPRKAYLREARERFAEKCRAYQIDVESSPRYERGLSGRSKRSEFVQMKRDKRKPNVDQTLIQKVIDERRGVSVDPHPAEEKMLKRNQQIRKRYAEKAKQLRQKSQFLPDEAQKIKYKKAADLLEQHAKIMPVEATRGKKIHRQLDQKYGNFSQGLPFQSEFLENLNQYYAVTQGKPDSRGIYVSPAEKLAKMVSPVLSDQALFHEQDIEMDVDD